MKAIREGGKREKQEFAEQDRLTNDISAGLAALRQLSTNRADSLDDTRQKIIKLRDAAAGEKHPEKARVARRAEELAQTHAAVWVHLRIHLAAYRRLLRGAIAEAQNGGRLPMLLARAPVESAGRSCTGDRSRASPAAR